MNKNWKQSYKVIFLKYNLWLNELKLVAKSRGIKGYKRLSKEKLVSTPNESESVESATALSKKSFDDERLKKIRKDFNELRGFQSLK